MTRTSYSIGRAGASQCFGAIGGLVVMLGTADLDIRFFCMNMGFLSWLLMTNEHEGGV